MSIRVAWGLLPVSGRCANPVNIMTTSQAPVFKDERWKKWFVVVFSFSRLSLFSLGCPGAPYVVQAGLELIEIHLPLLSECWD